MVVLHIQYFLLVSLSLQLTEQKTCSKCHLIRHSCSTCPQLITTKRLEATKKVITATNLSVYIKDDRQQSEQRKSCQCKQAGCMWVRANVGRSTLAALRIKQTWSIWLDLQEFSIVFYFPVCPSCVLPLFLSVSDLLWAGLLNWVFLKLISSSIRTPDFHGIIVGLLS